MSEPRESYLYLMTLSVFCSLSEVCSCSICNVWGEELCSWTIQCVEAASCWFGVDREQVLPDLTLVLEIREQCSLFTMLSVVHGCVSPQQTCTIHIRWESVPVASHSEHNPGQVRSIP